MPFPIIDRYDPEDITPRPKIFWRFDLFLKKILCTQIDKYSAYRDMHTNICEPKKELKTT
jgi:hypothetical protein